VLPLRLVEPLELIEGNSTVLVHVDRGQVTLCGVPDLVLTVLCLLGVVFRLLRLELGGVSLVVVLLLLPESLWVAGKHSDESSFIRVAHPEDQVAFSSAACSS